MSDKLDYRKMIIDFNSDKDIIALKEKYKEPTFFEIISKQRSETIYSSFLKWMFQSSSTDLGTVSPILLLLDVLVVKSTDNQIADNIKTHIITRNFKINSITVETEKSVSSVAADLGINNNNSRNKWEDADAIQKIIAKCQDRIDIFIDCDIELNDKNQQAKRLQIIIENKIDSGEGKGKIREKTGVKSYDEASQTERYYSATALDPNNGVIQLYVYLAPAGAPICDLEDVYVQIDYQDIVDGIIMPMLASSTLSVRQRFFLEELKTELTFPSLGSAKVRNSIANSSESQDIFRELWDNKVYKSLILDAAINATRADVWRLNHAYCVNGPDINKILKLYMDIDSGRTLSQWGMLMDDMESGKSIRRSSKRIEALKSFGEELGVRFFKVAPTDGDDELLEAFWNNNQKFLLAIMSGVKDIVDEKEIIDYLLKDSAKRDTTKYRVYYNGKQLNNTPANNGEAAWLIVRAYVENEKNNDISLKELNNLFSPNACNSYYSNGKWLKHLFYEYSDDGKYTADGTECEGNITDAGGWDFYKPKNSEDSKFQINLSNGEKVIMLKMWRKDDLLRLIEYVRNNLRIDLEVNPA